MAQFQRQHFDVTTTEAIQPYLSASAGILGGLFFSVEDEDIRFAYDGSLPSPGSGHRLYNGQSHTLTKTSEIRNFAFIAVTGTARVTCTVGGI